MGGKCSYPPVPLNPHLYIHMLIPYFHWGRGYTVPPYFGCIQKCDFLGPETKGLGHYLLRGYYMKKFMWRGNIFTIFPEISNFNDG